MRYLLIDTLYSLPILRQTSCWGSSLINHLLPPIEQLSLGMKIDLSKGEHDRFKKERYRCLTIYADEKIKPLEDLDANSALTPEHNLHRRQKMLEVLKSKLPTRPEKRKREMVL